VPLAIELENEVERVGRLHHVAVVVIGVIEAMLLQLVAGLHAVLVQLHLFRRAGGADQAIRHGGAEQEAVAEIGVLRAVADQIIEAARRRTTSGRCAW
jgi:hypothetical protein